MVIMLARIVCLTLLFGASVESHTPSGAHDTFASALQALEVEMSTQGLPRLMEPIDPALFLFGVEIETCVNAAYRDNQYHSKIDRVFSRKKDWSIICRNGTTPFEFVTKKLTFAELHEEDGIFHEAWDALSAISTGCALNNCNLTSCGTHVHISTNRTYDRRFLRRFKKMWRQWYQPFFIGRFYSWQDRHLNFFSRPNRHDMWREKNVMASTLKYRARRSIEFRGMGELLGAAAARHFPSPWMEFSVYLWSLMTAWDSALQGNAVTTNDHHALAFSGPKHRFEVGRRYIANKLHLLIVPSTCPNRGIAFVQLTTKKGVAFKRGKLRRNRVTVVDDKETFYFDGEIVDATHTI